MMAACPDEVRDAVVEFAMLNADPDPTLFPLDYRSGEETEPWDEEELFPSGPVIEDDEDPIEGLLPRLGRGERLARSRARVRESADA